MVMTRAQYIALGRRFGSGKVASEAADAAKRWEEDVAVLGLYGHGGRALTAFNALIASHTALRQARPGAITAKAGAISAAQSSVDACEAWLTRAYANLDAAGRADAGIEQAVATARGRRVDGLDAEVDAALAVCQAHKAALDPDCQPDALIAAGAGAVAAYRAALPAKATAKNAPVEDTEEIDFADGQLLELITAVNDAGRKAFRASGVRAKVNAYKYHHLRGRPSDTADDAPPVAEPPKPPPS